MLKLCFKKQNVRVGKSRKPHYFQTEMNSTPPSGMSFFEWKARNQRVQRIVSSIDHLFKTKWLLREKFPILCEGSREEVKVKAPAYIDEYPSESGDGLTSENMDDPLGDPLGDPLPSSISYGLDKEETKESLRGEYSECVWHLALPKTNKQKTRRKHHRRRHGRRESFANEWI